MAAKKTKDEVKLSDELEKVVEDLVGCLLYTSFQDIKPGDQIEAYRIDEVARTE